LEEKNFLGDDLINEFLDSGGKLIIILIPGPYESWMNDREDQPWIQELPWNRVSVTQ
jgi:cyclopropane fatty-acyl-phospholipid synthase-like methyltransferase